MSSQTMRGPVAALGVFDGVHLGHRRILEQTVLRARTLHTESLVLTFEPHPLVVLGGRVPKLINSLTERRRLIHSCGVDRVLVEPFTPEYAAMEPQAFFEQILVGKVMMQEIVVGYDYTFGRGGRGDVRTLHTLGDQHGIKVLSVPPVEIDGVKVSSTVIRNLIANGCLKQVADLLGRPFYLVGTVIHGDGRARRWQVPTANLRIPGEMLIPKDGVYVASVDLGAAPDTGTKLPAIVSIGSKPTFAGKERAIEVHVLDQQLDLYDDEITVYFYDYLRSQCRFNSEAELFEQIRRDVEVVRTFFGRR